MTMQEACVVVEFVIELNNINLTSFTELKLLL